MTDYSRLTSRELAELRILAQDAEPPYEIPCTGYNPHQTERLADGISERQRWLLALDTVNYDGDKPRRLLNLMTGSIRVVD